MRELLAAFSFRKSLICLFKRPEEGYYAIDGVRALPIIWVVILPVFFAASLFQGRELLGLQVDATPWYLGWVWNGHVAIGALFVISGFLIAGLLLDEEKRTDHRKKTQQWLNSAVDFFVTSLARAFVKLT